MSDTKEERIILRVSKDAKEKLQKLAEKDKRTLSDFIRITLEKLIETTKK